MFKKIFILICFLSFSNCSVPNSAFLGPIFTGARTGSVYQASLSYSSGKIMNELKQSDIFIKFKPILSDDPIDGKKPTITSSYVIDKIVTSDVLEPEPLP